MKDDMHGKLVMTPQGWRWAATGLITKDFAWDVDDERPTNKLAGVDPMGYPTKSPPEEIREQVARIAAWLAEQRKPEPTETESAVHRALMRGR